MAIELFFDNIFEPALTEVERKPKFISLQILRFIAAFAVVLFHLFNSYVIDFSFSKNYFVVGEFGVDIFFIISGFVITYTAVPEKGLRHFASKRIARIVPLYWLLTCSVAALSIIIPSTLNSTHFDLFNFSKSMFFIPYQKENGLVQPMLFLGWTLNYEMFFYLVLGWALRFGKFAPAIACSSIAALVGAGSLFHSTNVLWNFYTNPIMLEFAFGVLLCEFFKTSRSYIYAYSKLALLPAAVIAGFLVFSDFEIARPFGQGLVAMSIAAAALSVRIPEGWIERALVRLGDASYSLYLSHVFVIQIFAKLCKNFYSPELFYAGSVMAVILCLSLSLVLYTRFEVPAQIWLTKLLT